MNLTPYQKQYLQSLVAFRRAKPGVWQIFTYRPRLLLPWVFMAAVSFALTLILDERWGLFVLGMTLGAVLRVFAHWRFAVMAWPVTEAIVDWAKVETLRGQPEMPAPEAKG